MKKKYYLYRVIVVVLGFVLLTIDSGCKKMIEVDLPVDKITAETAYGSAITSATVLNGVYAKIAQNDILGLDLGYVSDELEPFSGKSSISFSYFNQYTDAGNAVFRSWINFYQTYLYALNSSIEGVSRSSGIGPEAKRILIGEAKFSRAFLYFYLVNLYGDVPLVLTTDFKVNSNISRSSVTDVYAQIIDDLLDAKNNLPVRYLSSDLINTSVDRVRPNKYAATALLARVYLYMNRWSDAELQSTELISNVTNFKLEPLSDVFLKNSFETIWALQPNLSSASYVNNNTIDGQLYIPFSGKVNGNSTLISDNLLNIIEDDDNRKQLWMGKDIDNSTVPNLVYYYPLKYKIGANFTGSYQEQQEFLVVFRLAEQYLIRAEARTHLGKITGNSSAKEDLDVIRSRAGLGGTVASTQEEMLSAIYKERQIELYSEWGHRWLDLKRTGRVNTVMSVATPKKGGTWAPYKSLFPIPYLEFVNNPALRGHQNPGYSEVPLN